MIAKIDKEKHAGDFLHMADYLETTVGFKIDNETEALAITLDSDEVRNVAWIAEQIRSQ